MNAITDKRLGSPISMPTQRMDKPLADERLAIIRRLTTLGEKSHQVAEDLRGRGFSAFVHYQRFMESFARSSVDLDTHRRWIVENAKVQLASCDWLLGPTYRSELLQRLLDEAARSPLARNASTSWIASQFADPCEQAAHLLKVENRAEYEKREMAMRSQCEEVRALEIQRYCKLATAPHAFGMLVQSQRFGFAAEVLRSETKELGFEATKLKPSTGLPIVAKRLTDRWRVSWRIGDPGTFYAAPQDGMLILQLVLEASPDVGPPITIGIPLHSLVYGIWFSHGRFSELASLEINLLARLQLYRVIQSEFESAVRSGATSAN